jgi:hypothetical protein
VYGGCHLSEVQRRFLEFVWSPEICIAFGSHGKRGNSLAIVAKQQGLPPINSICHPGTERTTDAPLVTSSLLEPLSALIKQRHDLGKVVRTGPVHDVRFTHYSFLWASYARKGSRVSIRQER